MNELDLGKVIIGGAVAIISYFLKDIHSRHKRYEEKVDKNVQKFHDEISTLKQRTTNIESLINREIKVIEEKMELQFKTINQNMEDLKSSIRHLEKTLATNGQAFALIYEEIKKKS